MNTVLASLLFILTLPFVPTQAAAQPTPADIARALQAHYETVRDFSADFIHAYEGGMLGKRVTEGGTVLVKKPGRMRWTYTAPERKEFVSDGRKMYSYIPEDKQVIIASVAAGDEADTPALFLSGKGDIVRDFTASSGDVPEVKPDTYALKLVPRKRQQEYDWLVLVVDRHTMQLRMLITIDRQGGRSAFTFTNLKENVGLTDSQFTFRIPRGVDIVTQDPRR